MKMNRLEPARKWLDSQAFRITLAARMKFCWQFQLHRFDELLSREGKTSIPIADSQE